MNSMVKFISLVGLLIITGNKGITSYWDFISFIIVIGVACGIVLFYSLFLKNKDRLDALFAKGFVISGVIGFVWNLIFYTSRSQLQLGYRVVLLPILYALIFNIFLSSNILIKSTRVKSGSSI